MLCIDKTIIHQKLYSWPNQYHIVFHLHSFFELILQP